MERLRSFVAANDAGVEPTSNIKYFFCEIRVSFAACLARHPGIDLLLYLLHCLNLNSNRMDAGDELEFPWLVRQLSAVTRACDGYKIIYGLDFVFLNTTKFWRPVVAW